MSTNKDVLEAISALRSDMNIGFQSIHKRLDGIEYELKKIDTVLQYNAKYDNIPA